MHNYLKESLEMDSWARHRIPSFAWRTSVICVSLCSMLWALPLFAHHGVAAHYDMRQTITVTGVVNEFRLINPHSFLFVETSDEQGEKATWECELPARNFFSRLGLPTDFEPGEQIRIEGSPHRRDPHACITRTVYREDGTIVRTGGFSNLRRAPTDGPTGGIEDRWILTNAGGILLTDNRFRDQLTPAGRAAMDAYDPAVDDPARRCSPSSPQRAWGADPNEILRDGDRVIIRHEFMDTVRTVYLDRDSHPQDVPRSEIGHSIGFFEDDGTLVIETARFTEGMLIPHLQEAGINTGIPHSDQLIYRERLRVNASNHLVYQWTAEDPEFYASPLTGVWVFARADVEVAPYNCVPDE